MPAHTWRTAMASVSLIGERPLRHRRCRSAHAAGPFPARNLRLTGTHVGCDTSQCGACVVHLDGSAVKSCTVLAVQLRRRRASRPSRAWRKNGELHPMQEAFREHHGLQCGFCTPGMIMAAVDIVNRKGTHLDEHTIREELEGNICRCTGYHNIVKAIAAGAAAMGGADQRARLPSRSRTAASHAALSLHAITRQSGGIAMTATGIGASVRRKEDLRFITGKGQLHRRHQPCRPDPRLFPALAACACQRSSRSTSRSARKTPGVRRGLHRRRSRRRQDRRPDLRLDDPFQGRLADEGRPASGARPGQGALCRRSCRRRHRRDAGAGQGRRRGGRRSTTRCCRPSSTPPRRRRKGAPQVHDVAPDNTVFHWHLGDKAATDAAFARPSTSRKLDLVNNRLVPNAMEPRAAIGDYDPGTEQLTRSTPPARTRMWRGWCCRPSSASRRSTSCA